MLAERDVAVDERGFHRREFCNAQTFLVQELVNGPCAKGRQKASLGVDPSIAILLRSRANEHGARGAERDEFV